MTTENIKDIILHSEKSEKEEVEENKIQMKDFFKESQEDYDIFEEESWKKGSGYFSPSFPQMSNYLEGWESGFYLFAAESNIGKSAAMTNILYDLCTHKENKLFGMYYSLDDSKKEIIPRIIAMDQMIPISVISKPQRYQALIDNCEQGSSIYQDMLDKRKIGLQKLKDMSTNFKIEDGQKITCIEDLYEHMKLVQLFVKSFDEQNNIVVAIDSINDLRFKKSSFSSVREKHDEAAQLVKKWTKELDIIILSSTHLKKLNQNRRPILDDLKESGEYVYEASVVWLLYNDVSKNKQSAKIYYNTDNIEDKQPIIEFDWGKNKKSSYKGRTFNYFTPEYSKMKECNEESSKRFNALVYEV